MDKCCALAIRLTVGVIGLLSSLACFIIAINLHSSGTVLSAWNGMADDDKILYIKIMVIGGLALIYGVTSLIHRDSKLSAVIPAVMSSLVVIMCLAWPKELMVFMVTAAILTALSILTLVQSEPVQIRWEAHEEEAKLSADLKAVAASVNSSANAKPVKA